MHLTYFYHKKKYLPYIIHKLKYQFLSNFKPMDLKFFEIFYFILYIFSFTLMFLFVYCSLIKAMDLNFLLYFFYFCEPYHQHQGHKRYYLCAFI